MNLPYPVISLICECLVDPNVPEYGEDMNVYKKFYGGYHDWDSGPHDIKLVPYDLLRLAQVNKTFFRVFMSEKAWSRFGSGTKIAQSYLKLKSQVPREVWDFSYIHRLLELGLHNPALYFYGFTDKYVNSKMPRIFNALYFVYVSRASKSNQFAVVPDTFQLDFETCKLWLKNSAYFEPTPLYYEYIPLSLRTRPVVLELLSLGLSLMDLPQEFGDKEAFEQVCKLPHAGRIHTLENLERLFKPFLFENLTLLTDIVWTDTSVLWKAPPEVLENKKIMTELCMQNPDCIISAHSPSAGRKMKFDPETILRIMEQLEDIDETRCNLIHPESITEHLEVDLKTMDWMIASTRNEWVRQRLIASRPYHYEIVQASWKSKLATS